MMKRILRVGTGVVWGVCDPRAVNTLIPFYPFDGSDKRPCGAAYGAGVGLSYPCGGPFDPGSIPGRGMGGRLMRDPASGRVSKAGPSLHTHGGLPKGLRARKSRGAPRHPLREFEAHGGRRVKVDRVTASPLVPGGVRKPPRVVIR